MSTPTLEQSPPEAAPEAAPVDAEAVCGAARELIAAGFAVTRTCDKKGTPGCWTVEPARPEDFLPGDGIGLICGPLSDGGHPGYSLYCLDGDADDALALGRTLLPETGMIDFRPGSGGAHFWYLVENDTIPPEWISTCPSAQVLTQRGRHPGPRVKHFKPVDVQGTGGMCEVPPTLHQKSGRNREWYGGTRGEPARIKFPDLLPRMMLFAEALGYEAKPAATKSPAKEKSGGKKSAGKSDPGESSPATPARAELPRPALYDAAESGDREVVVNGVRYPERERVAQFQRSDGGIPARDRSRSGEAGHTTFYTYAKRAANCYLIRCRAWLRELFAAYNDALPEGDRWSDREVEHKIDDALRVSDQAQFPAGDLLRPPEPPMAWDDPARLAGGFLDATPTLFAGSLPLVYDGRCYRAETKDGFAARVRGYAERAAAVEFAKRSQDRAAALAELDAREKRATDQTAEYREAVMDDVKKARAKLEGDPKAKCAPTVTGEAVGGAVQSIRNRGRLSARQQPEAWLDGRGGPALVSLANGLLDADALALSTHTPDYFAASTLPVAHEPAAPPPAKWLAYLGDVMEGDGERVAVLQELFGLCLDPGYPVKAFGLFVGPGENGKSAFTAGLAAVLGDENISAVPLDALAGPRGGFAAFDLVGKRANVVADQSYFEADDEGVVRTLTGGDLMRCEPKGMAGFNVRNTAKLIFGTNSPPRFGDKTLATWNRVVAVPFDWTVPPERRDDRMKTPEFWASEAAGMLNWGLEGLKRLKANKWFTRSAKCEALKARMIDASNPVRVFVQDHYRPETGAFTPTSELVKGYATWQEANGIARKATSDTFADIVATLHPAPLVVLDRGYTGEGQRVRGFVGLAKTTATPPGGTAGTAMAGGKSPAVQKSG